jgi:hypothetical protein
MSSSYISKHVLMRSPAPCTHIQRTPVMDMISTKKALRFAQESCTCNPLNCTAAHAICERKLSPSGISSNVQFRTPNATARVLLCRMPTPKVIHSPQLHMKFMNNPYHNRHLSKHKIRSQRLCLCRPLATVPLLGSCVLGSHTCEGGSGEALHRSTCSLICP